VLTTTDVGITVGTPGGESAVGAEVAGSVGSVGEKSGVVRLMGEGRTLEGRTLEGRTLEGRALEGRVGGVKVGMGAESVGIMLRVKVGRPADERVSGVT